jgi:hypothetical protein
MLHVSETQQHQGNNIIDNKQFLSIIRLWIYKKILLSFCSLQLLTKKKNYFILIY